MTAHKTKDAPNPTDTLSGQKQALHDSIVEYANRMAGTAMDLDEALEAVSLELWTAPPLCHIQTKVHNNLQIFIN